MERGQLGKVAAGAPLNKGRQLGKMATGAPLNKGRRMLVTAKSQHIRPSSLPPFQTRAQT